MMGYCGLLCDSCMIYLAARQQNQEEQVKLKTEIARLCNEHYGLTYRPEDITDCDGCLTQGARLFSPSRKCDIRTCAMQKNIENCACCSEFPCGTLDAFFASEPSARMRLDELHSRLR